MSGVNNKMSHEARHGVYVCNPSTGKIVAEGKGKPPLHTS